MLLPEIKEIKVLFFLSTQKHCLANGRSDLLLWLHTSRHLRKHLIRLIAKSSPLSGRNRRWRNGKRWTHSKPLHLRNASSSSPPANTLEKALTSLVLTRFFSRCQCRGKVWLHNMQVACIGNTSERKMYAFTIMLICGYRCARPCLSGDCAVIRQWDTKRLIKWSRMGTTSQTQSSAVGIFFWDIPFQFAFCQIEYHHFLSSHKDKTT